MSAIRKASKILEESDEVYKVTQEVLNNLMQRGIDAAYQIGAPEEVRDEMLIEWKGGKCLVCKKPYEKENILNKFADFEYYKPTCKCVKTEGEKEEREQAFRSKLLMARIPKNMLNCNFEGWDYGVDEETNTAMKIVYEYVKTAHFEKEGLVCYGQVGTGKSHCAVAALKAVAWVGHTIEFCQMSGLVKKLIDKEAETYLGQLMRAHCVLFDDLDKVSTYKSEWVRDQVFNLFDRRISEKKLIMATTNMVNSNEFIEKFGEATTSRLMGATQFVEFKGRDYRQVRKERK